MRAVLRLLAAGLAVAGLAGAVVATDNPVAGRAEPAAAATWNATCTSGFFTATGSGYSPDEAHKACARNVWNKRYGNFGGWTITGISYTTSGAQVFGRRPGTNLYVSAFSRLV